MERSWTDARQRFTTCECTQTGHEDCTLLKVYNWNDETESEIHLDTESRQELIEVLNKYG